MAIYDLKFSKEERTQPVMKEGPLMMVKLSLKENESLTKHSTPHILYLQCLQGSPTIVLYEPEERLILKPQQMIRIDAKREHAVYAENEDALLILHLLKNE